PLDFHTPVPGRALFGQILRQLDNTISFDGKLEVVEGAKALNDVRIQVVHKLTKLPGAASLASYADQAKAAYDRLFGGYLQGIQWFHLQVIAERSRLQPPPAL
ncbi:MAG: hypothetical protein ACREMO_10035, partial [Gemmatimonadales bacterium]